MSATTSAPPFSPDSLNRFRMAHPDRELRSLIRRLTRLPCLADHRQATEEGAPPVDHAQELEYENELARLEIQKWRLGIERQVASVSNLERQRAVYLRKAEETASRTASLKQTLSEEKAMLVKRQAERDHRVKCDDVAKKILARGRTRRELDEQIETLQASIVESRAAYEEVLGVAQTRADAFSHITALVEECRALKLPASASADNEPVEVVEVETSAPTASSSNSTRLSAQSLPFQPTPSGSSSRSGAGLSSSAPNSRQQSPAPAHSLPSRPGRGSSRYTAAGGRGTSGLPARPSQLRTITSASSLEEGEVGGDEEGEVKDSGNKRKADGGSDGRSTRSRAK